MPHHHIKVLLVTLFQSGYFTAPPVKVEKLQPYKINVGRVYVVRCADQPICTGPMSRLESEKTAFPDIIGVSFSKSFYNMVFSINIWPFLLVKY